ncbi:MBL fold metallo-hydrolase [Siccirubricoccus sp. G192]|uniref:MBL fold metallo-hydrolase n=1 Tax=Siccirubricoccus sp. G192 TaxID=2849651 RepID=UPI002739B745|nr:MBL fold metallo-hydrolase [Siccirubricoccus sp. G192]
MGLKAAIIPVTPFEQNCALLWEESTGKGVVVDPGGDVERILAAIAELKIEVERILLTHGHMDHAGGAAALREALGQGREVPPPIIGPDARDQFLLEGLAQQGAKYGLTDARNVTPDQWLAEGDSIEIAGHAFAVLHCPGHTPGHVVFVSTELRIALVGDVLFRGSIGRTDFPYGDPAALLAAIHGKLLPLGDDIAFLCGHGPGSTLGHERRRNPFLLQG